MSFATEYRQSKKSSLRFELMAYSVVAMFACLVLGTVALGVMAWNAPSHKVAKSR